MVSRWMLDEVASSAGQAEGMQLGGCFVDPRLGSHAAAALRACWLTSYPATVGGLGSSGAGWARALDSDGETHREEESRRGAPHRHGSALPSGGEPRR